jgi:hypothetical protein
VEIGWEGHFCWSERGETETLRSGGGMAGRAGPMDAHALAFLPFALWTGQGSGLTGEPPWHVGCCLLASDVRKERRERRVCVCLSLYCKGCNSANGRFIYGYLFNSKRDNNFSYSPVQSYMDSCIHRSFCTSPQHSRKVLAQPHGRGSGASSLGTMFKLKHCSLLLLSEVNDCIHCYKPW